MAYLTMPEDEAAPVDTAMDSPPGTPAATEDAHADPPFALETKKVFVLHADSRVGGVLGRAFRDAGCDVRGVRDGEAEVEFAHETYMADYDVSGHSPTRASAIPAPNLSFPPMNECIADPPPPPLPFLPPLLQRHDGMRRAALAAADIVLIPLAVAPDTEAAKDTIEAVEAALAEDGKRRVMIGVSSASSWAGGTQGPAPWTAEDVERRASVRGPGKLVADAERLVARAHKPGRLECFCVLPGTLYGEGEFEDGFLGLCRRAWEGESVPVFGDGSNVLPLCHAGHVAAVAKALAVEALNPSAAMPEADGELDRQNHLQSMSSTVRAPILPGDASSLTSRYVLTVDEDTPWASQIEIAAAIAVEFGAKLARFPAAALATTERVSPNLLTDARFVSSDVAKRAIAACETRHRGGWGAPVEIETPEVPDVLNVEDEKTGEGEAAEDAPAEGEEDGGSPWELAPPKVGGAPAVLAQFLERNNLRPLRLLVRGPPLSFPDGLAAQIAEAYSTALLTPASLVRHWLPKCDQETKDKCGYVEPEPEPEAPAEPEPEPEGGDDAGVEKPKGKTAEEIAEEEAAAKKEAEETYAGYAEDVKADLIKTTMSLPEVKRVGYVLAGVDVPPVPTPAGPTEICAKLFTWIPPRPEMRLKPKPPPAEGEDAEGDAEGGAEEGGEEAAPVEEEPVPELPEESAEAAEARRCADPAASLTDVILLKIADDGRHAHSLKDKHPEEHERYVEWAKAETEAIESAAAAKKEYADAAKEWKKTNKGKKEGDEGYEPPPAEPSPACTDVLVKYLAHEQKSVTLHDVDARGTDFARLRGAKRVLAEPRNFVGMVGLAVDALDPAEVEAARLEAEADAADIERRRVAKARSETLVRRQEEEAAARECDALHARSASLRAYLASEVMPTVTDAMLQMLRIRPDDPALARSDYLLRKDKKDSIEEEAERAAKAAMERALLEEEKKQEKERRLEISRRKAAEARAAIKPRSVVRFVPKVPPPRARPPPAEEAA